MSITTPSIDGLETSGPWQDLLQNLDAGKQTNVVFPGHEVDAYPQGSEGLWNAVRSLQDALGRGASIVLEHRITPQNAATLRDCVRFIDDELRAVHGVRLCLEPSMNGDARSNLAHYLEAAAAECVAREIGYVWEGFDEASPRAMRPIGPKPPPEREIEPENVIVAHVDPTSPDYSMALDKVMAPLGDFPRFINPLRLTVGAMDLENFADEDPRDGKRLRHHARPTPWVLLNLGLYREGTPNPVPNFQLIDSVVVKCLAYGTLPHLAVVIDGAVPEAESFTNLEIYCAERNIPFLCMRHDDVEEVGATQQALTQASLYAGHGEESLVFDYVISFASVQSGPYVGVLDQALAQWPPSQRKDLIDTLTARWKQAGEDSEPLTRWLDGAMRETLEKKELAGLIGWASAVTLQDTHARLQPWARRARVQGTAVDLTRAGRPDLWLIEAPEAEILVAGTDPIPIERLLVDASGVEDEVSWLSEAVRAGDPYAKHEGGLIQGAIPDAVVTGPARLPKHRTGKGFTVLGIACTTLQTTAQPCSVMERSLQQFKRNASGAVNSWVGTLQGVRTTRSSATPLFRWREPTLGARSKRFSKWVVSTSMRSTAWPTMGFLRSSSPPTRSLTLNVPQRPFALADKCSCLTTSPTRLQRIGLAEWREKPSSSRSMVEANEKQPRFSRRTTARSDASLISSATRTVSSVECMSTSQRFLGLATTAKAQRWVWQRWGDRPLTCPVSCLRETGRIIAFTTVASWRHSAT